MKKPPERSFRLGSQHLIGNTFAITLAVISLWTFVVQGQNTSTFDISLSTEENYDEFSTSVLISSDTTVSPLPQPSAPVTSTPAVPKCERPLDKVIRVAILLPAESTETDPHNFAYYSKLEMVRPAIELAAIGWNSSDVQYERVKPAKKLKEILPDWRLEVLIGDTNCSSTYGPLRAFEYHCLAGQHCDKTVIGEKYYLNSQLKL